MARLPFLDRKAALLRDTKAGILLNEHVAEDGPAADHRRPARVSNARSP
jgi:hypothetical protein